MSAFNKQYSAANSHLKMSSKDILRKRLLGSLTEVSNIVIMNLHKISLNYLWSNQGVVKPVVLTILNEQR